MQITSEQIELRDLVRRFFNDTVSPEYIRTRIAARRRRDEKLWSDLSSLGLSEGFAAEDTALSSAELGLIAEEVGRALLPEPLIERLLGDALLPRLLTPASRRSYAAIADQSAFAPASCCACNYDSKSKCVTGEITWAFGVEDARRIIGVITKGASERVFVAPLDHAGVTKIEVSSLDLTCALSAVRLTNVPALLLKSEESKLVLNLFEALKACEVYGICARVLEMSADYLKTREQFGVPVGAFQAVQQRIADAYAHSEALGALSRFATWCVNSSPQQLPLTALAAISQACDVGPMVCEAAIQVHGGIGFTWEYDLHLYLRRAKVIQSAFALNEKRAERLLERASAAAE